MDADAALEDIVKTIEEDAPTARDAPLPLIGTSGEATPDSVKNSETSEVDSAGVAYDPAIHTKSRARTKDGRWRKSPPGRPPAGASAPRPASRSSLGGFPDGEAPPAPTGEGEEVARGMSIAEYRAAAAAIVGASVGLHAMTLGEDWLAGEPEMKSLVDATTAYFAATGQTIDFPPWIGLAGAYMSYAGPRFQKPNTRNRLKAYFAKIRQVWAKYRPKPRTVIPTPKPEKMASADSRPVDQKPDWFAGGAPAPL